MGKLRFYNSGKYVLTNLTDANLTTTTGTYKVMSVNWRDINGNDYSQLRPNEDTSLLLGTLYATAETEQTFDEENYTYTEISGVTLTPQTSGDTVNVSDGKVYRTASVKMQNTGESSATVPSVTFVQKFGYSTNSGTSYRKDALSWCYIFDTPITLNAGETKTVVFNFGYTLPTNDD